MLIKLLFAGPELIKSEIYRVYGLRILDGRTEVLLYEEESRKVLWIALDQCDIIDKDLPPNWVCSTDELEKGLTLLMGYPHLLEQAHYKEVCNGEHIMFTIRKYTSDVWYGSKHLSNSVKADLHNNILNNFVFDADALTVMFSSGHGVQMRESFTMNGFYDEYLGKRLLNIIEAADYIKFCFEDDLYIQVDMRDSNTDGRWHGYYETF